MDIADSVIRNYRLERTHFSVPMLISQSKFHSLSRNPLLVKFRTSPLDYQINDENRVNVVTDRLKIVYCLFNEIIGVSLLNVLIRAV